MTSTRDRRGDATRGGHATARPARRLGLGLVLLVALVLAQPAHASAASWLGTRWSSHRVTYRIALGGAQRTKVAQAVALWNRAPSALRFVPARGRASADVTFSSDAGERSWRARWVARGHSWRLAIALAPSVGRYELPSLGERSNVIETAASFLGWAAGVTARPGRCDLIDGNRARAACTVAGRWRCGPTAADVRRVASIYGWAPGASQRALADPRYGTCPAPSRLEQSGYWPTHVLTYRDRSTYRTFVARAVAFYDAGPVNVTLRPADPHERPDVTITTMPIADPRYDGLGAAPINGPGQRLLLSPDLWSAGPDPGFTAHDPLHAYPTEVAAHELGHVLGLDHSNDPCSLMYAAADGAPFPGIAPCSGQRDDSWCGPSANDFRRLASKYGYRRGRSERELSRPGFGRC